MGNLRLVVHTLGSGGQATWHVAERTSPSADAAWVSIACGQENTTTAAMSMAEAEASRLTYAATSGDPPPTEQARLEHLGVAFFLAPIVPVGTLWTIYPASEPADGADSGVVFGEGSFETAIGQAQAAIGTWLLAHPDDRVSAIH